MNGPVSFHRLAQHVLTEAAQFYDMESPGRGPSFLDEVERCTQAILKHPQAGPIVIGPVRRRPLPRFPYALLYSVNTRCNTNPCRDESEASTDLLGGP